jgi:alkylation response protein AidB-like acyl-CoA dehydrogenase
VGATLLDFERSGVNWSAQGRKTVERLTDYAKDTNGPTGRLFDSSTTRQALAELRIGVEASRLLSYRVAWMQGAGLIPNYEASMSKVFGSELGQRIANFGLKLLGMPGQNVDAADVHAPLRADIGRSYMRTVPSTIAAGTSEIQRNIIATRGLGLPRG